MKLTLVSLYGEENGEKNKDLAALIEECQTLVTNAVGGAFHAYPVNQVHATIIGLEQEEGYNFNFKKHQGRHLRMNVLGFLDYLRGCGHFPLKIQIGGFGDRDYPFTSRNLPPYERSFSIQGKTEGEKRVVMMGWPLRVEPFSMPEEKYPLTLDNIRKAAQGFDILHSYHDVSTAVDNDLFFRIGLIDKKKTLSPNIIITLQKQLRQFLSEWPLVIEISLDDISIAAYVDDKLPLKTTKRCSLKDPEEIEKFVDKHFES